MKISVRTICRRVNAIAAGRVLLATGVAAALAVTGCSERGGPDDGPGTTDSSSALALPPFDIPAYPHDRRVDTVIAVDLDGDGRSEYVVGSLGTERMKSADGRADRIEIYRFDTGASEWKLVSSESLLWVSSYQAQDLTGDNAPEVVVTVSSGGNDPMASNGLAIFTGSNHDIRLLCSLEDGNPQLATLKDSALPVVLMHASIWPPSVPHAYIVEYVKELYAFDGGRVTEVKNQYPEFFRNIADSAWDRYTEAMKDARERGPQSTDTDNYADIGNDGLASAGPTDNHELFDAAAKAMVALRQVNRVAELRSFWNRDKNALRKFLPSDLYDQLEVLYTESVTVAREEMPST